MSQEALDIARFILQVRRDTDNFWLVEFDGTDGSHTILDEDKAIESNSCAKTFTYDGTPILVADAPEEGDCVQGL
ncbi:MAG: hypothetical protein KJN97_19575 [Deltaproteobacteria bacterium]|nr:hypothetical protein [Deltaproteobacteria bacterium]